MKEGFEKFSEEFKVYFLLEFTRKMVLASLPIEYLKQKEKELESQKLKRAVRRKISLRPETIRPAAPKTYAPSKEFIAPLRAPAPRQVLRVPKAKLPPQFSYLRPVPVSAKIDLGKLNALINDPSIKEIQCNGPDEKIIVKGPFGTKLTELSLTNQEFDSIIEKFSQASKIPVSEGVTKIIYGSLELTANISKEAGSRFVIKKII